MHLHWWRLRDDKMFAAFQLLLAPDTYYRDTTAAIHIHRQLEFEWYYVQDSRDMMQGPRRPQTDRPLSYRHVLELRVRSSTHSSPPSRFPEPHLASRTCCKKDESDNRTVPDSVPESHGNSYSKCCTFQASHKDKPRAQQGYRCSEALTEARHFAANPPVACR